MALDIQIKECVNQSDINATYSVLKQLRDQVPYEGYAKNVLMMQNDAKKYRLISATYNNSCVGLIGFSYDIYRLFIQGKTIYIEDLVVDKNYRKQGIAKKLISYVEDIARNNSCKALIVDTALHREEAKRFYVQQAEFVNTSLNYKKFLEN